MAFVPLRGFAPDLDESTEGLVVAGSALIPTRRGLAAAPSPVNSNLPELSGTAVGAASLAQLDNSIRTYAGTPTRLYQAGASTWTERTRSEVTASATVATAYTSGNAWRFAQLGNESFATNNAAVPQVSTGSAFSDLTGAPVCAIIEAANNQLFAFDTNEATFGDQSDRWWASALGDPHDWTPSISTQAVSGRLLDTPGSITAGRRLFNNVVAYKEKSLYLGLYQGPPTIWSFQLMSDEVGAVSQEAVIPLESVHLFAGIDDFYLFDGARPRSIGGDIREFFFQDELDADNRSKMKGTLDRERGLALWAYPSAQGAGAIDKVIAYNLRTARWAPPQELTMQLLFGFIRSTGPTYDSLGDSFTTYDDLPGIPYDSSFWSARVNKVAIFNSSARLQTLDGEPGASAVELWRIGGEDIYTFLHRLRPRFTVYPTTGTLTNSYADNLGQAFTTDSPVATLINGKFDFEREARWHKLRMAFEGNMEIVGVDIAGVGAGDE